MKGKRECILILLLSVFCLMIVMPLAVYGADLKIGSGVSSTGGDWSLSGNVTANSFVGGGSSLTGLTPGNIASGTANINISGNAATVSNGVYTSVNYTNPSCSHQFPAVQ